MIVYMCTLTPSPSLDRQIFQLPNDYYLKTIRFFGCIFIRNIRKIETQSIKSINKPSMDARIDDSRPNLVHEINIMRIKADRRGKPGQPPQAGGYVPQQSQKEKSPH